MQHNLDRASLHKWLVESVIAASVIAAQAASLALPVKTNAHASSRATAAK